MKQKLGMEHGRREASPEFQIVQSFSVHGGCKQKSSCNMAWSRHQDRWAAGATQPVAGTHFGNNAWTRVAEQTRFVCDDTFSSWAFLPEKVVGVAPYATDGATSTNPKGALVFRKEKQKENKNMPKKNHASTKMEKQAFTAPDELHYQRKGQCWTQLQRRSGSKIRAA